MEKSWNFILLGCLKSCKNLLLNPYNITLTRTIYRFDISLCLFRGDDYMNHVKCMTEEEKYCGKAYVPKVNKGEAKQEEWIEVGADIQRRLII